MAGGRPTPHRSASGVLREWADPPLSPHIVPLAVGLLLGLCAGYAAAHGLHLHAAPPTDAPTAAAPLARPLRGPARLPRAPLLPPASATGSTARSRLPAATSGSPTRPDLYPYASLSIAAAVLAAAVGGSLAGWAAYCRWGRRPSAPPGPPTLALLPWSGRRGSQSDASRSDRSSADGGPAATAPDPGDLWDLWDVQRPSPSAPSWASVARKWPPHFPSLQSKPNRSRQRQVGRHPRDGGVTGGPIHSVHTKFLRHGRRPDRPLGEADRDIRPSLDAGDAEGPPVQGPPPARSADQPAASSPSASPANVRSDWEEEAWDDDWGPAVDVGSGSRSATTLEVDRPMWGGVLTSFGEPSQSSPPLTSTPPATDSPTSPPAPYASRWGWHFATAGLLFPRRPAPAAPERPASAADGGLDDPLAALVAAESAAASAQPLTVGPLTDAPSPFHDAGATGAMDAAADDILDAVFMEHQLQPETEDGAGTDDLLGAPAPGRWDALRVDVLPAAAPPPAAGAGQVGVVTVEGCTVDVGDGAALEEAVEATLDGVRPGRRPSDRRAAADGSLAVSSVTGAADVRPAQTMPLGEGLQQLVRVFQDPGSLIRNAQQFGFGKLLSVDNSLQLPQWLETMSVGLVLATLAIQLFIPLLLVVFLLLATCVAVCSAKGVKPVMLVQEDDGQVRVVMTRIGRKLRGLAPAQVLVAQRGETGPFAQAVVLLVAHSDAGSTGFLLNKPITPEEYLRFGGPEAFQHSEEMFKGVGGPVSPMQWTVLHRLPDVPDAIEVGRGIFVGGDVAALATAPPGWAKVVYGAACWEEQQLDGEILAGCWNFMEVPAEELFTADPAGLWERLQRRPCLPPV